jgi:hypothetical protein
LGGWKKYRQAQASPSGITGNTTATAQNTRMNKYGCGDISLLLRKAGKQELSRHDYIQS